MAKNRHRLRSEVGGGELLYLTDEQLRGGIEAMFFAYRGFVGDPDRILAEHGYGRAHHRALHFIGRNPGITVGGLIDILAVTKQSVNRVLRRLEADGLVIMRPDSHDRRLRHLYLADAGSRLEASLSQVQRRRMRIAYRAAGPEAVAGFRAVLHHIADAAPEPGET